MAFQLNEPFSILTAEKVTAWEKKSKYTSEKQVLFCFLIHFLPLLQLLQLQMKLR